MTENDLKSRDAIQKICDTSSITEHNLKEGVNLENIFHSALTRLIALKFNVSSSLIWSYKLTELDEEMRLDLKTKVRSAMAFPKETGAYRLVMESTLNPNEANAVRFVELEGLLVLGMLRDKEVILPLLERLREEPKDHRMRITAGAVLRYLTGQNIGSYVLSDEDLTQWEEWWKQNRAIEQ